ncbi:LysM peptidoglycan-binding domain-containing protein [Puteibacter caeruleilacunae]|nr:LysM peptidoglycan-binding domain-containing protein [Puteibacter caeruleilacunae]
MRLFFFIFAHQFVNRPTNFIFAYYSLKKYTLMRKLLIILNFLFFMVMFHQHVGAQNRTPDGEEIVLIRGKKFILHTVEEGETINSLVKKYGVERKKLIKANSQLLLGVRPGDIISIPYVQSIARGNKQLEKKDRSILVHLVKEGETSSAIAKKYGVSFFALRKENPFIDQGISAGMRLVIPEGEAAQLIEIDRAVEDDEYLSHIVIVGDTWYSISKKYNKRIAVLKRANPEQGDEVSLGTTVRIPKGISQVGDELISDGTSFSYLVETGDTYFSLKQRFGLEKDELIGLNPALENGLNAGLKIKIPAQGVDAYRLKSEDDERAIYHEVQKGETIYALAIKYNKSADGLKELNPNLKVRGLIAGEKIVVGRVEPVEEVEETEDGVESAVTDTVVYESFYEKVLPHGLQEEVDDSIVAREFNVGVFLPLYLDKNDEINTEAVPEEEIDSLYKANVDVIDFVVDSFRLKQNRTVYSRSQNFLKFYEGFLLAAQKMENKGIKVNYKIYDTARDPQKIDSLMRVENLYDLDLIVGPIYESCQAELSAFSFKNRIPMISPLSPNSSFTEKNPFYFQVNSDNQYQIDQTVDFMVDEFFNKNLIVLNLKGSYSDAELDLVKACREKFFSTSYNGEDKAILYHEYDYSDEGFSGLRAIMSKERENVIFLPSSKQVDVSVAVNDLKTLAEDYNITFVGTSSYPRYTSIQTESYHKLKLTYLSPFYVDYTKTCVIDFVRHYREVYFDEPDQYSFQGYDVATYFLTALSTYDKTFIEQVAHVRPELLQADYHFERTNQVGGFLNKSLFKIRYTEDYKIENVGSTGDVPLLGY